MDETVKYIWVATHYNGDREPVSSIGTYSSKELAQKAAEEYIKIECDDWPLHGEFIHYSPRPIDKWYLDENKCGK